MDEDGWGISPDICVRCYTIDLVHVFSSVILCMGDIKTMDVLTYGYCDKHVWIIINAFKDHSLRPRNEYTDEILMKRKGEKYATFL